MIKKTLILLSVTALGACAYAVDGTVQDVKFVTPGAKNAACIVSIEKLKYKVKPPQTVNLYKSRKGLDVDCKAPGNRRKTIHVKAEIEKSASYNAANGGIGLAWDYVSSALFRYPDVIEIDFRDIPITEQALPAHNSPDIRQPEEYDLEEFLPGVPRMNADRTAPSVEIRSRERAGSSSYSGGGSSAFFEPAGNTQGKGDLVATPTPLIPGE